jgi:3-oxoacyl-[acyl-carrier-protein] synthase-3
MTNNYIPVRIAGVGYGIPDAVVTNDDLTKLYETSDEWIYTRTGIKERRVVSGDQSAIDLGLEAAEKALAKSGIAPSELDLIIAASSAPPQLYPAIACHIQSRLGIETDIPAFDITAACSGLIYGMQVAKGFINSGIYKNILIVATDNNTKYLDWTDRGTSILFGDGAGAMVLTASEDGVDDIVAIDIKAKGSIGELIYKDNVGHNCPLVEPATEHDGFIHMNGKEVYKFVVRVLPQYIEDIIAKSGMKAEDIDYLIPHQANLRIIQAVQERLEYSDEKVITNIKYYGNTSAASVPIALAEGVEKGTVKLGSTAILCGFGAGMTWGGAIVRLREGIC